MYNILHIFGIKNLFKIEEFLHATKGKDQL